MVQQSIRNSNPQIRGIGKWFFSEGETIMDSCSTALVLRNGSEEEEEVGERLKIELNEDDIVEILKRLPVKSLLRFKCVSKLWYSLILSSSFVAMHFTHTSHKNTVSLMLGPREHTRNNTSYIVNFDFGYVPKKLKLRGGNWKYIQIVGCSNGVICLSISVNPQKYALWNPATRQSRLIGDAPMDGPEPTDDAFYRHGGWYGSGFCFDSRTDSFKVAQINFTSTGKSGRETRAQVNVFSTATSSWIENNQVLPYRVQLRGSTSVNGSVHWYVRVFYGRKKFNACILSYNMIDGVFNRIEMPVGIVFVYCHLTAYKGSLAMFVQRRNGSTSEVDVWVLNACGGGANQSWSKLLTCSPFIKIGYTLGFFIKDNADLVLLSEERTFLLHLYDPRDGETKKFWKTSSVLHTFPYNESFVSLH